MNAIMKIRDGNIKKIFQKFLTKEEREALKNLSQDKLIVIKEVEKGSAVVVWDINDYLQEADQQISDKDVYEEVTGEFISPLVNTIKQCIAKSKRRGDVSQQTEDYFFVENPRIGRFYLITKNS